MRISIRLLVFLAVASLVCAAFPVDAGQIRYSQGFAASGANHPGRILTLDRRDDGDRATPAPIVPPDKDPKPGLHNVSPGDGKSSPDSAGLGSAILGVGGAPMFTKSQMVERSLRATAERLR